MDNKKEIGLIKRISNLKKFIQDGRVLNFSLPLISNLTSQLHILESEHQRDKNKRDSFYNSIKIQKCKNVVQKCSSFIIRTK